MTKNRRKTFELPQSDKEKYKQITIFEAIENLGGVKTMFNKTEKELIKYMFKGLKNPQIALLMSYSEVTIKKKKQKIYKKINCNNQVDFILTYSKTFGLNSETKGETNEL